MFILFKAPYKGDLWLTCPTKFNKDMKKDPRAIPLSLSCIFGEWKITFSRKHEAIGGNPGLDGSSICLF